MTDPQPIADAFAFEPLRREHLRLLRRWLAAGHVSPWFGPSADAEEDPLGERGPVRRFIAARDGQPVGLIQMYRWCDVPDAGAAVGARPGEIGIDYLIGEPELIGRGLGPAMIEAFLARFCSMRGEIVGVRVDVSARNERSWRCLEKLGFRRQREGVAIAGQAGPHYVYVRDC